ncbi:KR domain-containing protein [Apodospora peruviana]|uniref:KR domain-containing protein n=1 Tax=Apodospora peruviana TaxID=516989 RepID=A0AAE0I4X1_9PEZI|nr:KR domain-containing protein [Apodospora peruviana]
MNILAGPKRTHGEGGPGCECSGVVTRVRPDVKGLKVGDRVISIAAGSFATKLMTRENLCAKMPDNLGFSEGETIPCVYGTRGQTVLIHSAAGGVGLSAIQVAQMVGAKIYCTVSNAEKIDFLVKRFGIPRTHIFNSQDSSFLRHVMAATNGWGVNVVLNSLSGELLHASWKCVAEFGVMVEIGKRDFIGQAALSMDLFEQDRSFQGVDLTQISSQRPVLMNSLLRRAIQFFEGGHIKPIGPIREFDAARVKDAFRYMPKGQHIRKIIVMLPEPGQIAQDSLPLHLRSDRAYLLVGGLGGLGRSIASWMVEKGARHIIFFSRSAGSVPKDDPYFRELEAQGCFVQTFSGSVSKAVDVARVIRAAGKPIGGVFQASMVPSNAAINEMTFDQWQIETGPKVQGTWNLHKLLLNRKEPLDFFFLFSSLSGLAGQIGQANYAAANTFLDALVQFRQAQGLPASVLDIGVMDDVGFLTQGNNTDILEALRATTLHVLHEQDLLDSLELMMRRSRPGGRQWSSSQFGFVSGSQVGIGFRSSLPLLARNNRTIWRHDPRMAVYRQARVFLAETSANPGYLLQQFEDKALFLAKEIDLELLLEAPLSSLGVDSLVSIELRHWIRQKIGAELTVLEIVGSASLVDLGGKTVSQLRGRYAALGLRGYYIRISFEFSFVELFFGRGLCLFPVVFVCIHDILYLL